MRVWLSSCGICSLAAACLLGAQSSPATGGAQAKAGQSSPQPPQARAPSAATSIITGKNGDLSREEIRELVRKVADNDLANDRRQRDYTYTRRETTHKLNNQGQVIHTESTAYEVMELYGEQVERLIAKDDKPLDAKHAAKEESRIEKLTEKRRNESPEERQKRLAKEAKERDEDRAFVNEIADAYDFRLAGIEKLDGRETYVIDAEPRPGYQPHVKEARILPKFRLRVWIDKAETQWVKLDAQAIDTVSFGWFLARLHKGSRVEVEQTQVNGEVWLPKRIEANVDLRVALLKEYNVTVDEMYRDYKKFRTSTRIVGIGQADPR